MIQTKKAIVYVDFVHDVSPLAIALRQKGVSSCSYHGQKMSAHDKTKTLENWQKGEIQVMVCTTAFGMGVNTPGMCDQIKFSTQYTCILLGISILHYY